MVHIESNVIKSLLCDTLRAKQRRKGEENKEKTKRKRRFMSFNLFNLNLREFNKLCDSDFSDEIKNKKNNTKKVAYSRKKRVEI